MSTAFSKDADTPQQPASTTKVMTALVMNDYVSGAGLDATVTVTTADVVDWSLESNAQLLADDVISYRDLLFGMMLPSGNDAAKCIARTVGAMMPGGGDPTDKFLAAMNTKAAALGMTTAVFVSPSGVADAQRMSPNDLSLAMLAFSAVSYLVTVSGTLSRTLTITGVNARSYAVNHTINPDGAVKFPEFICGKTGTYVNSSDPSLNSGACLVMLWQKAPGVRRVSVVMGSATDLDRYKDMRRLIDFEKARP